MITTLKIMTVLATFLSTGYVAVDSLSQLPSFNERQAQAIADEYIMSAQDHAYNECIDRADTTEQDCEDM